MTPAAALWAGLAATAGLVALHAVTPLVRRLPHVSQRAFGSFAGGAAVSYVFLHLLPKLSGGQETLGEALDEVLEPTPLLELTLFAVAMTGFVVLYGLERLAVRSGSGRAPVAARRADDGALLVFRLHLGSFAVYNLLITYTLPTRFETGAAFAVLFALALGLHFVLTDRGLAEHYPQRFARRGRFVLGAALLAGWLLAALAGPPGPLLKAVLTALLAGAILLNVFKEELPSAGRSSFPWFLAGAGVYAALLAIVTVLQG